ncbi:transglycosylase domain-containing protein [Mesobacillus foraminis]|uniref:Penicillin-binding protein n=1 Tax=Mesobacillus foraminis TaxID=279826 RepID=A0A4V6NKQ2_9BACI|nr:transglycosylase domain-containing protein [Mesobacillus foraminis]TCN24410.1 penicillin-binding protein [Mesobacillus foraminis]
MNQEKRGWKDRLASWQSFFTNKKTVKSARITYGVVWNLLLLLVIVMVVGAGFSGGAAAGYFASLVKDEPVRSYEKMRKDIYNYEETSDLYFDDNVYLGKLRTDLYREEVKLDDVSKHLVNAVVATEDEYFYEHDGVVPKAILRALFQEVTNSSTQSGGSTLTQQLIKNQILTNEISFERKAKEILLALRLEKFFDKKEILEAYLNVATFGRNAAGDNIAGVQSAANGIFGVDAKDLSLPQAAFIAGLPQSPFGYTPFSSDNGKLKEDLEPGLTRMKTVLSRMHAGGFITEKEYNTAVAYDITKDFIKKTDSGSTVDEYPYLTFEIEKRAVNILAGILAEKAGYEQKDLEKDKKLMGEFQELADRNLRQNGYKVHTTINKKIYDQMQKTAKNFRLYGNDKPEQVKDPETGEVKTIQEPVEVGAILIENKTGKIISFVGGRNFEREQLNHATDAKRQNGSTMKPLLVYAPAMELGQIQPGTVLPDVEVYLNGPGSPWPHNYDRTYSGLTTARKALTKSYNVPAVIAYKNILNQKPTQYLEKMGFTSLAKDDHTNLSAAIGSIAGVTVEENVNAFGTFANGGKFVDAYLIDKITDKDGNIVFKHKPKPVDVFSPQTAYLTLDMMRDVINQGTATPLHNRLKFSSDWAGKTGTGHNYYDSWFVATNPNVSFGVWNGYDTQKSLELRYNGVSYGARNIYLWADLMNAAYDVAPELVDPDKRFEMPGGIVRRSFCSVSGLLPSKACSSAGLVQTDLFNAKFAPTRVDDSLSTNRFVRVGDRRYFALDSTPSEFVETGGVTIDPSYMESLIGHKIGNAAQLMPRQENSKILVASSKLSDNGKTPAPLAISGSGKAVSWGTHPENDIIGYRVYNNGKKVATVRAGSSLSYTGGNGSIHVTAVDIAGRESAASNIVKIGEEKPKETPKPADEKKPEAAKKPQEENKPQVENKPEEKKKPEAGSNPPEEAPSGQGNGQ